jgi:hypothetical protein
MSKPIGTALPREVIDYLVGGNPVSIATVGPAGEPYGGIIGSCIALDASTLRFAAFGSGHTVVNLRERPGIFVETLGDGLVIGISGTARIVKDPMDASAYPPHNYVMVEVTVRHVKDDHPPGVTITGMSYNYSGSRQPATRRSRRDAIGEELRAHPR